MAIALTKVQHLRLAVLLPLAVPVPVGILITLLSLAGVRLPERLAMVAFATLAGSLLFFVPYVLLMGGILAAVWRRSWRAYAVAAMAAPWLMGTVLLLMTVTIYGPSSDSVSEAVYFYIPYCLVFGYGYVAIALLGLWMFAKVGIIRT